MPLMIDGGRIPPCWAARQSLHPGGKVESNAALSGCVRIAFVNNMPDPALIDTEIQFFELLEAAAGGIPVRVRLHSLSGIPRGERGQQHLSSFYFDTDDLLNNQFDAVIMTGTEPRQSNLRNEPYWSDLANILDWAESNTVSTILSCLAAHAGVLHSDRISRHPLREKQFGVFEFAKNGSHKLTAGAGQCVSFPHSRWNEVQEDALTACGYLVLTRSAEGGVDSFVKKKKRSLFLHFQGHPEYGAQTLLKEYRRDIKRFLKRERETYPSMPKGYFDAASTKLLNSFREAVLFNPREELLSDFPEAALVRTLQNTWHSSAVAIYRNWLQYVFSEMAEASAFSAIKTICGDAQQTRSALS